ncbi:flavin reductase family protein [Streptomyces sp. YGL11-2]|uniref:flavin reductase family protein n=1 Tax=Streptomyces sp. YGL11-2 TaxID=3414028 RepID=UPI003CF2F147
MNGSPTVNDHTVVNEMPSVDRTVTVNGTRTAVAESAIRPEHFRDVLGRFATGIVVVTGVSTAGGLPVGLAVNSFTSVSLTPPLVLFCIGHDSTSWPEMRGTGRFNVNILAEGQRHISARFASRSDNKFRGIDWSSAANGMPVIDGVLGLLECTVEAVHAAGDHDVVVARVHRMEVRDGGLPLLFYRGGYGRYTDL